MNSKAYSIRIAEEKKDILQEKCEKTKAKIMTSNKKPHETPHLVSFVTFIEDFTAHDKVILK